MRFVDGRRLAAEMAGFGRFWPVCTRWTIGDPNEGSPSRSTFSWGGVAWVGPWGGKTPTGGRRCPPEARATLRCFVKFDQKKWELPRRFTSVYRRRCAGKLVDSNAGLLGCFFPQGQPGPKPRFVDVAFTTPDGWSLLSL